MMKHTAALLGVTLEEMETLKQAFQLYDPKGLGGIPLDRFADVLKGLGIATDPVQIQAIIRAADANGDNLIDFDEFVQAMAEHIPPTPPPESEEEEYFMPLNRNRKSIIHDQDDLVLCFQQFDKNKDGLISRQELEQVMADLGERMTAQEIKDMMDEADTNKDGFIDFEEFKHLLPPI
ncbi:hypothetical protein CLU79DRAFT_746598 [Phycomyces nitens]|nr:hypothetical protein CLU79DRAFT_746598 [Phycomyces nitens]